MTIADEPKRPFWAKCWGCGHCWPAAYLPMPMGLAGKVLGKLHCPMCGEGPKKVGIAKQDNGRLMETTVETKSTPSA